MLSVIFFFQAEDGIRDWSVTGVQTCALPIYAFWQVAGFDSGDLPECVAAMAGERLERACSGKRSEERRVGKESNSRGRPAGSNKTIKGRTRGNPTARTTSRAVTRRRTGEDGP